MNHIAVGSLFELSNTEYIQCAEQLWPDEAKKKKKKASLLGNAQLPKSFCSYSLRNQILSVFCRETFRRYSRYSSSSPEFSARLHLLPTVPMCGEGLQMHPENKSVYTAQHTWHQSICGHQLSVRPQKHWPSQWAKKIQTTLFCLISSWRWLQNKNLSDLLSARKFASSVVIWAEVRRTKGKGRELLSWLWLLFVCVMRVLEGWLFNTSYQLSENTVWEGVSNVSGEKGTLQQQNATVR